MTKYIFIDGRSDVNAQAVGERLEFISNRDGKIKSRTVVDDARPVGSPLHPCFEWNNEKAGEHWRLDQAAKLIRSVRIMKGEDAEGEAIVERPFISIKRQGDTENAFYATVVVMSSTELRQLAISDAMGFVARAKGKLAEYKELEAQYKALEKVENDLVTVQMKLRRAERAREVVEPLKGISIPLAAIPA